MKKNQNKNMRKHGEIEIDCTEIQTKEKKWESFNM